MRRQRRRMGGRIRRGVAAIVAMALATAGLVSLQTFDTELAAVAAPGNPGVPGPPQEIYREGFENGMTGMASSLRDYRGAQGESYTSNPFWTRQDQCNGVVVRYESTTFPSGYCTTGNGAQNNVRRMADVLGQVAAGIVGSTNTANPTIQSTPETRANHAVTAWTGNVDGPNNAITLETQPFDLTGQGARFLTASINVAEVSCTYRNGENNSRLNFSLVSGGQELALNRNPIRACTDPNVRYYSSPNVPGGWGNGGGYVAAGRFYADSSYLIDPAVHPIMSLRMRNLVGTSQGNDFAYDEVRLFDATPQLDKSFSPTSVPVNGISTLTFTVTNTADLAEKRGWRFTDSLPDGLVVASPPNVGGNCTAQVAANAGADEIVVTDGVLLAGERSCTISVNVTSAKPYGGDDSPVVYANCAENVQNFGLNPPACAEVEFYSEPHLTVAKQTNGSGASRVGDTIRYTVTGTNDGTGNFTAANPATVVDDLSAVLDDADFVGGSLRATVDGVEVDPPTRDGDRVWWSGPLPAGSAVVISYDVVLTGAGDDRVANVAFPSAGPYDSANPPATPACGTSGSACTEFLLPGIALEKSVVEDDFEWGSQITYRFVVTNTGAVPLSDVTVDEVDFDGSGDMSAVSCPATTLQPNQSMTCEATYTGTDRDVDRGSLKNTATASGTPPQGERITSAPDDAEIPAVQYPGIEIQKFSNTREITEADQEITYWFRVFNTGNLTLTNVTIEEAEFSGTGEMSAVSCPSTTLPAFRSMLCSATYVVTQEDVDAGELTNTARVTANTPSGGTVGDDDTVRTPGDANPEITLTKYRSTNELVVGRTFTYWFRVENTGNMTLEPPEITEVAFTGSGEMTPIVCEDLGEPFWPTYIIWCSADYTITQADLDAGRIDNTAVATTTTSGDDPIDVRSNESSTSIPGSQNPAITLDKTADVERIAVGQPVQYRFTVTNTGNISVGGISIEELEFSGSGDMSEIVCEEGVVLAPQQSTTCTASYTPTQEDVDAGGITNTAVANGVRPGGQQVVSDPDEVELPSEPAPALTIDKRADRQELVVGETITYTFVVRNTGNVTLSDVTVAEASFTGSGELSAIECPADEAASLAPGDEMSCTATYEVTQADVDAGGVQNSATASGTPPGGGDPVVSEPDEAQVPAVSRPAIAIEKTADTDTLVAGETVVYSFLVTNTGNVTLEGIVVVEEEWTGRGEDPEIVCPADEAASLAPGRSVRCTAEYLVVQADVDAGRVDNTAGASGLPPRASERVFSELSDVTLTADAEPGLELTKSADRGELVLGDTVTYTFVVRNTGNVTLTEVTVEEGEFSGSGELSAVSCPSEPLPPGESVSCTARYEVTQEDVDRGTIENTASATGRPPSGDPVESDPADARVPADPAPAIEIVKSADTTELVVGETVTYSFVVTNTGNVTLREVTVEEGEFTGSGSMSAIVCEQSALAPDAQTTCSATYEVTQEDVDRGSVENTASATGRPPSGDPVESDPSRVRLPQDPEPGISLTKSGSVGAGARAGDEVTYSFEVENTGNVTLTDVVVEEGDFSGTGELSAISCPDDAGSLLPGRIIVCTATYVLTQADVDAGGVTNSATVTGTPPGDAPPVTSPPSEAEVPLRPEPGIALVKSADTTELVVGETVTYSFEVTNTGNVTLTEVSVAEGEFTGSGQLSVITCPATTLAPDEQVVCTATYEVTQDDVDRGSIENSATANGAPPNGDPVVSDPSRVRLEQSPEPGIALVKSADTTELVAGETVTYSFEVTNTGNVTLTEVSVAEGEFTGSGQLSTIACPAEALPPGQRVVCTATYEVTQDDVDRGSIENTATASGAPPNGARITSEPSAAQVPANPQPGISLVKSASPERGGRVGDEIVYTFRVTNVGTVTLSEVGIDETAFSGTGRLSAISCPSERLAPGASVDCTARYLLTQADVDAGEVTNSATATGTPPGGRPPVASPPSEVRVPIDPEPAISLMKSADTTELVAGETITYSFVVTNTGNVTLEEVAVAEGAFSGSGELSAVSCPDPARLESGAQLICTASYVVTQADVDRGTLENTATSTGTPPGGDPVESPPSRVLLPQDPNPAIELVKTSDTSRVARVGQLVTYRFVVTNVGNVTLDRLVIDESSFSGAGQVPIPSCPAGPLAPGQSVSCTTTYVVLAADLTGDPLRNTAIAVAEGPGKVPVRSTPSSVTIPTALPPGPQLPRSGVELGAIALIPLVLLLGGTIALLHGRRRRRVG